jgi:hypothetical protein
MEWRVTVLEGLKGFKEDVEADGVCELGLALVDDHVDYVDL